MEDLASKLLRIKHVGVLNRKTKMVLELTDIQGSDGVLIREQKENQFGKSSSGRDNKITMEPTVMPQLPDDQIEAAWVLFLERFRFDEIDYKYSAMPSSDKEESCESFAELVLTGEPSAPQAEKAEHLPFGLSGLVKLYVKSVESSPGKGSNFLRKEKIQNIEDKVICEPYTTIEASWE